MINEFKKFTKTNTRQDSLITVTSHNSFGMTTKFYQEAGLTQFNYVTLFFSEPTKAVGFQFHSNENEPHKFKLVKSVKYGASVLATSFFKANNIDTRKYRGRYQWTKEVLPEVGEGYVIVLKERITPNIEVVEQPKPEGIPILTPSVPL